MLVAVAIALLSLILIYLEFFVPGIVLGVLGGVGFFLSIFLFIWESGDIWPIIFFISGAVIFLILTIRLALWKMKQRPAFFASEEQSGYLASEYDHSLIGNEGKAATDLKPSGYIEVEGEKVQAVSESLYIKKGESVTIVGGEGARYIVRRK